MIITCYRFYQRPITSNLMILCFYLLSLQNECFQWHHHVLYVVNQFVFIDIIQVKVNPTIDQGPCPLQNQGPVYSETHSNNRLLSDSISK